MPVTTTTGAGSLLRCYTGTVQEVLDAYEAVSARKRVAFGTTGATAAWAIVRV